MGKRYWLRGAIVSIIIAIIIYILTILPSGKILVDLLSYIPGWSLVQIIGLVVSLLACFKTNANTIICSMSMILGTLIPMIFIFGIYGSIIGFIYGKVAKPNTSTTA